MNESKKIKPTVQTVADTRLWEPLNGTPLHGDDEVRQDFRGITTTAVVGLVDEYGDPWTTEGSCIGRLDHGTWYVRRPVQELPTEDGAVIVPAEGREFIEAVVDGKKYRAREAMRSPGDGWYAAWRSFAQMRLAVDPENITPGTWKVADR